MIQRITQYPANRTAGGPTPAKKDCLPPYSDWNHWEDQPKKANHRMDITIQSLSSMAEYCTSQKGLKTRWRLPGRRILGVEVPGNIADGGRVDYFASSGVRGRAGRK